MAIDFGKMQMSYNDKCALLKRIYCGETEVAELTGTPFEGFGIIEWVRYFADRYGGYDGSHHKDWVIDQIVRISYGTPIIVKKAVWEGEGYYDENWRVSTGDPTTEYYAYVSECEQDGVSYDCGVAP